MSRLSAAQTIHIPPVNPVCQGSPVTLTAVITGAAGTNSYSFDTINFQANNLPLVNDTAVDPVLRDNNGTLAYNKDDTWAGPFPIGFEFCYMNQIFTQYWVGSNGWISFSNPLNQNWVRYDPFTIPSTVSSVPKNAIFGPYQDWYPSYPPGSGPNNIFRHIISNPPNSKLVIYWNHCPMFGCTTTYGTFQIVLCQSDYSVQNNIATKPACDTWEENKATQGVINSTGTVAYVAFNRNATSWTATNESTHFIPSGTIVRWHLGSPSGPIVAQGDTVTFIPPATNYYFGVLEACTVYGNSVYDSVLVTVNPLPLPTLSGNTEECEGSALNAYSTQNGMSAYSWSVSPGGLITSGGTSSDNSVTVTWNASGTQSVSVSYTDNNGCTASSPYALNVTVHPLPVPALNGTVLVCAGTAGNVYTTQAGMNNYTWNVSPGGNITSGGTSSDNWVTVTWNVQGVQYVMVSFSDTNACTAAAPASLYVTVNPLPIPSITGPASVCILSSGNIYSTEPGMNAYSWTVTPGGTITGGQGTDSITVSWTAFGQQDVSVMYSDPYGCSPASPASFNVTVNPLPGEAGDIHGPSTVCKGTSGLAYSVLPVVNASGYFWTLPHGFSIVSGAGTNSIIVSTADTALSGTIMVYGTNSCGNGQASPAMEILVSSPPTADAGPDRSFCSDQVFTITGATANNYASLAWSANGTGTLTNNTTLSPTYIPGPSETGTITLSLVALGEPPCKNDTSVMHLTLVAKATVNAGVDISTCGNRPVTIQGSVADHYTSLQWMTSGDGTFDNPGILHPTYIPGISDLQAGQVTLTVNAYSAPLCNPDTDKLLIMISNGPSVTPGPDGYICQENPYTVQGFAMNNSSGYSWESDGQGQLINTGTLNPVYIPAPGELGSVKITLKVSGLSVCSDSTVSCYNLVHIYTSPGLTAGKGQTIKYDSSAFLSCDPSGGTGNFSFEWMPGVMLVDNTVQNPQTVNLIKDTVFIIRVTDKITGCTATDSSRVKVEQKHETEDCIVVHNVITPNGDGINDKWIIDCIEEFPDNTVKVFNRWGEPVNSFVNYNNKDIIWGGTTEKGEMLPDGTYFFILQIRDGKKYTGWVFLHSGVN